MNKNKKHEIADGGMFASAMLGMADTGEEMQPSLFEPDPQKLETARIAMSIEKNHQRGDVVYFVQETSSDGYIKIGYSNQVSRRIEGLRTDNAHEIKVLLILNGDRKLEHEMHRRFWDSHTHGDWFRQSKDLIDFIESNIE